MKPSFLFVFLLLQLTGSAQLKLKLQGDSIIPYTYSGGDEFSGDQLNETEWKNGLEGRRVIMTQDLCFSPNNVMLEKGLIRFLAKKEDSIYVMYDWEIDSAFLKRTNTHLTESKFLTHYSAGSIMSKQKQHYGYYEIRFKVEEGRGIWPAFWFFGGKNNDEIDVFELKCEKNNSMHLDTHCPYGCDRGYKNKLGFKTNWGAWMPTSKYLHEGFNVMALDWKKDEVFWYLNGYPVAYFKGDFPTPMNLYLNTSVAKDGDAFDPGPDSTTKWPNTYFVDYLRVWQQILPTNQIALKINDDLMYSTEFVSDYQNRPTKKRGLLYWKRKLNPTEGSITLNIDSQAKLSLHVLGKCKDDKMSILIKGVNTNVTLTDFGKEILMPIDLRDVELEITISTLKRHYTQKILLHR
jgi:beta-glucanase (GH16 family)